MQTKKHSLYESFANVGIGFGLALLTAAIVFPLFGIESTFFKNIGVTFCFTGVSLIRGYVIRRWFARKTKCIVVSAIERFRGKKARQSAKATFRQHAEIYA